MNKPPPFARWLVGLVVHKDEKPFLLADLEEEFGSIAQTGGQHAARRWYWSQVLRSVGPSAGRRFLARHQRPHRRIWFGGLNHDFNVALRSLMRAPTYTTVVILTLAFGMGSFAAVTSVVNAVLIQNLPFPHAEQLLLVREVDLEQGGDLSRVSPPNFLDWRDQASGFVALAASTPAGVVLQAGGRSLQVPSMQVSAEFFDVLRVRPERGRAFVRSDEYDGANQIAVVSQAFWKQQFGNDEWSGADATISLDDVAHKIVGILPDGFRYLNPVDIWLPLPLGADQREEALRGARYLDVIGRTVTGLMAPQVTERFSRLAQELSVHPNNRGWSVAVTSLHEHVTASVRQPLLMLSVAVGFVLVIVAANVATLVMARATQHWRQFALRAALGATMTRLSRQMLVEHALIVGSGTLLGGVLAFWVVNSIVALAPLSLPDHADFGVGGLTVTTIGVAAAALTIVLTSVSMFVTSRLGPGNVLHASSAHSENKTVVALRHGLIVGEIGLCLVLLIGAVLLTQSFIQLRAVDPGFTTDHVVVGFVSVPGSYATSQNKASLSLRVQQALEGEPSLVSAAVATNLPMSGSTMNFGYVIDGREVEGRLSAQYHAVSASYFETLEIPFRYGRRFEDDATVAPTVIINETLARRFWRDRDPVGQRMTVVSQNGPISREIVGVIADVRHADPTSVPTDEVYVPYAQDPWPFFTLIAKSRPDVGNATVVEILETNVYAVDPLLPLTGIAEMDQVVAQWRAPLRFQMILVSLFASFALLLAGIGIYGVIAFFVGNRTNEIGVRMALGAGRPDILRMVVSRSLLLTSFGLALGLLGASLLASSIQQLLFGVSPHELIVYVVAVLTVLMLSLVASIIPARRASAVDPVRALRDV